MRRWAAVLLFAVGLGILCYPTASDLWNRWRSRMLLTQYTQQVRDMGADDAARMLAEAEEYNVHHRINVLTEEMIEDDYVLTHPYDTLLDVDGTGLMGSVEIPSIGVYLPVYHGTGASVLEKGVGHLPGTSLPVGGAGTHAVLSAHTGLPSARLFTDLDQLAPGDVFYIRVLQRTLAYRVDRITTVLPSEAGPLAIDPAQDYVTLLTCTPYGNNTHRLLVRGVRMPLSEAEEQKAQTPVLRRMRPALVLGAALAAFLLFLIVLRRRSRKDENADA